MIKHNIYKPISWQTELEISEDKCRESVSAGHYGIVQCSRKAKIFETINGEQMGFCKQHSLKEQQKKEDAWLSKYNKDKQTSDLKYKTGRAKGKILEVVLKEFEEHPEYPAMTPLICEAVVEYKAALKEYRKLVDTK